MSGRRLRVALMMGGQSAEREVSLNTGRMIARFLDKERYEVLPLEIASDGRWLAESPVVKEITAAGHGVLEPALVRYASPAASALDRNVDVVFLALHGPFGEDGTIQGLLELLNLPYTCSGVLASALAMDKFRMKAFVRGLGVTTAEGRLVSPTEFSRTRSAVLSEAFRLSPKLVVKPNRLGSSVEIRIVENPETLAAALEEVFHLGQEALVEEFVAGIEVTAPVLGNQELEALPLIEIVPNLGSFYDYESKYAAGGSDHIIPARLAQALTEKIQAQAAEIHGKLGCRGVTRSDFIVRGEESYFLEINTIPGMTATSLVPQAAEHAGYSFQSLLSRLIELALEGRADGRAPRTDPAQKA